MVHVINPSAESFSALARDVPGDTPIVMLNLLRFREQANYPDEAGYDPCSGIEAYARYSRHATKAVAASGGEVIWAGHALSHPITPPGEQWDHILMVRYPNVHAFLAMVMDESYQQQTIHRTAALEDARLVCMQQDG